MNLNDYKDTNGNVEVSETLVSDLIGGINGIVESGSNENGNWIRSADGTQICWYNGTRYLTAESIAYGSLYTGAESWTFPMAFVTSNVVVSVGFFRVLTGASWGTVSTPPTTTSVDVRYFDITSRAVDSRATVSYFAIGRWK